MLLAPFVVMPLVTNASMPTSFGTDVEAGRLTHSGNKRLNMSDYPRRRTTLLTTENIPPTRLNSLNSNVGGNVCIFHVGGHR